MGSVLMVVTLAASWYHPVDIGQHVEKGQVKPIDMSEKRAMELFSPTTEHPFSKKGKTLFEQKRRKIQAAKIPAQASRVDPAYRALDGPWQVRVHSFSKTQVRLWVAWKTGVSRWHHMYDLVADIQLKRSKQIDKLFGLKALDERYTLVVKGVGHGMTGAEMDEKLGDEYSEYIGQSPSFRNIYYPQHDLHVTIQDQVVKFVEKGRPGWMSSDMVMKPSSKSK